MNNFIRLSNFAIIVLFLAACGKQDGNHKEGDHNGEAVAEWREMDDFHFVMAETFHPYRDSSNLEPVRQHAGELKEAAERWLASEAPGREDAGAFQDVLKQLHAEASDLVDRVRGGDDDAIGEQLNQLHDTFHKVQDMWYGAHSHSHH